MCSLLLLQSYSPDFRPQSAPKDTIVGFRSLPGPNAIDYYCQAYYGQTKLQNMVY